MQCVYVYCEGKPRRCEDFKVSLHNSMRAHPTQVLSREFLLCRPSTFLLTVHTRAFNEHATDTSASEQQALV